tara:strand:+ start:421 stop:1398 length:978 start_codon:yes stop_codon:yes gene_type:complete
MFSKKAPEITFKIQGESDLEYINGGKIKEKLQQLKHKINDSFTREIKRKIGNNLTKKNKEDKDLHRRMDRRLVSNFEEVKNKMLQKIHDAEETGYLVNLQEYLKLYYKIRSAKNITNEKVEEFNENIKTLDTNLNKQKYDIKVMPEAYYKSGQQMLVDYYFDKQNSILGGKHLIKMSDFSIIEEEYEHKDVDPRSVRFIGPYRYFFPNAETAIRLKKEYKSKDELPNDTFDKATAQAEEDNQPALAASLDKDFTNPKKVYEDDQSVSEDDTAPTNVPQQSATAMKEPMKKDSGLSEAQAGFEGGRTRRKYRNKKLNKKAHKSAKK